MKSMKNFVRFFIAMALVLASAVFVFAQSDIKISIQGTLKDANSSAVDDGAYDVTFRLYNTNSGGTAVWEETANVQVSGGVYSHRLGSIEALDASDFSETLFVGVEVNGVELSPRTELTYAPYTLNTQFAARAGNGVPAGSMMPFAGPLNRVPDDYIPCDGRALSSSEYPELFAAIGTAWGNGTTGIGSQNGNTDFNVPDSRGVFLRGWANGESTDPDRSFRSASAAGGATGDNVGTYQGDEFESHNHTMDSAGGHTHTINDGGSHSHGLNGTDGVMSFSGEGAEGNGGDGAGARVSDTDSGGTHSHTMQSAGSHMHTISSSGGNETRSKNIAVLYIIKK